MHAKILDVHAYNIRVYACLYVRTHIDAYVNPIPCFSTIEIEMNVVVKRFIFYIG